MLFDPCRPRGPVLFSFMEAYIFFSQVGVTVGTRSVKTEYRIPLYDGLFDSWAYGVLYLIPLLILIMCGVING